MSDRLRGRAPKAAVTSDVERPRILALATLGAAAGVIGGLVAEGTPLASERPIARPHAKVACASCHASPAAGATRAATNADADLSGACASCHASARTTTRKSHRKLAASGELTCATCHRQHGGGQGLTFEGDEVVRWGAGAELRLGIPRGSGLSPGVIPDKTTVPLVPLAVCARCHDPSKAADPIARCVPAAARGSAGDAGAPALASIASQCFDEHPSVDPLRPRFVVDEAVREVASTTPWISPTKKSGAPWMPAAGALVGALVVGTAVAAQRRRKEPAPVGAPPRAASVRRLPTIQTSTCLGCYACVDACPFDVLVIDKYVAVVARPDECCGVVTCEQVCPNGSLRVEDGEPVDDHPATDEHLESRDVPGLYLAGDLTGLPLIKNAIQQGFRAAERIAVTLPKHRAAPLDVLVIGAGPAGLSAALHAKERGLRGVVLEQATVAASIKSFPRDKIVHDPPLDIPSVGELWLKEATKEELLAQWTRIVRTRAIDVRERHRVVDVRKDGAAFVVVAEDVALDEPRDARPTRVELRATRVIVAIGRRGTPRRIPLAIEPGAEDRVAYALADARSFTGKRVVVVGLGDTAMEAAIALARQPGTQVTISYRGSGFSRGKARNIAEVQSLVAKKRLRIFFETVPVAWSATAVTLEGTGARGGRRSVGADALLVLAGGVPAWDLLSRAGIRRRASVDDV